ncbi:hypothetical protein [Kutzneria sp. NPDC052558]|uniref:hypothetical protein n=1 Tax=Kutzneria sp. NPDC052558 TaxID=3364121 RepID=UPI0037C7F04D
MRPARFNDYLFGLLQQANHQGIAKVEPYDAAGQRNIRVVGTDGITIELMAVGSAPSGGDPWQKPEKIVTKPGYEPRPMGDSYREWQEPSIRAYHEQARE